MTTATAITPSQPWWQTFPEDFHRSSNRADVPAAQVWKIKRTAALDKLTRLSLATAVTAATLPNLLDARRMAKDIADMEFYKELASRGDPSAVFAKPAALAVRRLSQPWLGYHPFGVQAELLGFKSSFVPVNPAVRDAYAKLQRNRRSVAHYWHHGDRPRPTLIWMHGVVVDPFWLNSLMFSLGWFYKQGYDILLYTLPFHGYRMERRDLLSGMGFFSHGMPHVNEAMLQSVHDLRGWVDFLEQRGAPSIGVGGMSLGGYITSLAVAAEPRISYAIPNVPVVMPADMLLEWQPTAFVFRRMMKQNHISVTELRHALAVHSPLTWQPAIATERLLIIGGAGDRFTSPRYVKALHEHWQGSELYWFPGNHILHLEQGDYLRRMKAFMDRHSGN